MLGRYSNGSRASKSRRSSDALSNYYICKRKMFRKCSKVLRHLYTKSSNDNAKDHNMNHMYYKLSSQTGIGNGRNGMIKQFFHNTFTVVTSGQSSEY